jgi:gluconolactonase
MSFPNFTVSEKDVAFVGSNLRRPECILAFQDGTIMTSHPQGVLRLDQDGSETICGDTAYDGFERAATEAQRYGSGSLPNGFARLRSGEVIIANFGRNRFERIAPDGRVEIYLDQINGHPIGKANFVYRDHLDRLWLTVSVRTPDWVEAVKQGKIDDGLVILVDESGPRVVASDLGFTNEVRLDASGEWLYVVETFRFRISRFRVAPDGSLSNRQIFGPDPLPVHPDGIAFDEACNLWIVAPIDERVVYLDPQGKLHTVLDLGNPDRIADYHRATEKGDFSFDHVWRAGWNPNPLLTGLAFGGPDRKTVFLGSLGGHRLPSFHVPVAGLEMAHWRDHP